MERYFNLFTILFVFILALGFWMVKHYAKETINAPKPANEPPKVS